MATSKNSICLFGALTLLCSAGVTSAAPVLMHGWDTDTNLYSVESTTGVETLIGSTGISNIGGIATAGNGQLYGMTTTGSLYAIDGGTAAATLVGTGVIGNNPEGLTFGLDGATLYTSGGGSLYLIDTATGAATNLGAIGMPDVDGLTVAPFIVDTIVGSFAAGTIFATDSSNLFAIDPTTLLTTPVGEAAASEGITFAGDGMLYGHTFGAELVRIDPLTLVGTTVATTSWPIHGLASGVPLTGGDGTVPAPATLALLGLGLVAFARRRPA